MLKIDSIKLNELDAITEFDKVLTYKDANLNMMKINFIWVEYNWDYIL